MNLLRSKKYHRKPIAQSKILLAGPVRNVAFVIEHELKALLSSLDDFAEVYCFVVESDSSDDTLKKLEELQGKLNNFSYISAGDLSKKYHKRTDRIALCRNSIIDAVAADPKFSDIDYVAMADMDGMNDLVTPVKIAQCWDVSEPWDVITANQLGEYYDIWALSHPAWNPMDCWEQKRILESVLGDRNAENIAVKSKQGEIDPRAALIEVDSAFGGLGIYMREAFLAGRYEGTDIDADGIDVADHIPFHKDLRKKGYRIFINPALINCNKTPQVIEEPVLIKPKNILNIIRKLGVLLFGKKRFNKYLDSMKSF